MVDYALGTGIGQGVSSFMDAYMKAKQMSQQEAVNKKLMKLKMMEAGIQETPEGDMTYESVSEPSRGLISEATGLQVPEGITQREIKQLSGLLKPKKTEEERGLLDAKAESLRSTKGDKKKTKATTAETQVDKEFAKDYNDFIVSGGYADVQKGISQLDQTLKELEQDKSMTGPSVGLLPRSVRAVTSPKSLAAQERVEEVVQRNLRLVLGAQFTEREGKLLMEKAYNPSLPASENINRIKRLMSSIQSAANAKKAAADYYEENGTLKGYKGATSVSLADIEKDAGLDSSEAPSSKATRESKIKELLGE